MKRSPSIGKTIAFIRAAHAGQKSRNGTPYYRHPMAVMARASTFLTMDGMRAALLHDVLEDTDVTIDDLADFGFSPRVIELVVGLTNGFKNPVRPGKFDWTPPRKIVYKEFIERIVATGDIELIIIKYFDCAHNSDRSRLVNMSPDDVQIVERMIRMRYRPAMDKLRAAAWPDGCMLKDMPLFKKKYGHLAASISILAAMPFKDTP